METAPKRSPLQFSIKTLLLVTLLVASFLGGRASMMNRVEEAELRSKADRDIVDHAHKALLSAVEEENDFKKRHGISELIR
ncbi:MAG TPA: hypothetical protein VHB99_09155, partial [Pirellulales bacterium]|nr:hypothetical protein [Pirellulales bacterium]